MFISNCYRIILNPTKNTANVENNSFLSNNNRYEDFIIYLGAKSDKYHIKIQRFGRYQLRYSRCISFIQKCLFVRLRDERDANARLRGETGIMRKKFTSLQNEIDVHKEDIKKLQGENGKLNNVIKNLEKDIAGLKKEIQERDETIQVSAGIWKNKFVYTTGSVTYVGQGH